MLWLRWICHRQHNADLTVSTLPRAIFFQLWQCLEALDLIRGRRFKLSAGLLKLLGICDTVRCLVFWAQLETLMHSSENAYGRVPFYEMVQVGILTIASIFELAWWCDEHQYLRSCHSQTLSNYIIIMRMIDGIPTPYIAYGNWWRQIMKTKQLQRYWNAGRRKLSTARCHFNVTSETAMLYLNQQWWIVMIRRERFVNKRQTISALGIISPQTKEFHHDIQIAEYSVAHARGW